MIGKPRGFGVCKRAHGGQCDQCRRRQPSADRKTAPQLRRHGIPLAGAHAKIVRTERKKLPHHFQIPFLPRLISARFALGTTGRRAVPHFRHRSGAGNISTSRDASREVRRMNLKGCAEGGVLHESSASSLRPLRSSFLRFHATLPKRSDDYGYSSSDPRG